MKNNDVSKLLNDKGVTAVIVAVLLTVFIGIAALAVDIGYLAMVKNESQNASDSAALAGARQLGENYANKIADPTTNVVSVSQITAGKNKVAGQNLAVGNINVKIGTWDPTKADPNLRFTETATSPMAVQVTTSAAPSTFFGRIYNLMNMNMATTACAIIGGPCEGKPTIPLGISKAWFSKNPGTDWCGTEIILGDTMVSCGGWTNLSTDPFKQQDVQKLLQDALGGTTMPEVSSDGPALEFGGGTVTPILTALKNLFDQQKSLDGDGDNNVWTTDVLVYDSNSCENPVIAYKIVGFATFVISAVNPTGSNKGVIGKVKCQMTMPEPGGCFSTGTLGTIPRLVN